jgi:hypothetical protein
MLKNKDTDKVKANNLSNNKSKSMLKLIKAKLSHNPAD